MQLAKNRTHNRLSKILANAGVASRRACEELISKGRVKVNGKVVTLPQTFVTIGKDQIVVDNKPVATLPEYVYYILNKPEGYLCTSLRPGNSRIVLDLFPKNPLRLFTVGRLDRDTTGLLIVTNDGHFANRIMHPSFNVHKEYLAKTNQEITHEHLTKISAGTQVEDAFVRPVRVTKVRKGTVKIVVMEGKKREVRELLANAGLEVQELRRIRIGGLRLDDLPIGSWRILTEKERKLIFA